MREMSPRSCPHLYKDTVMCTRVLWHRIIKSLLIGKIKMFSDKQKQKFITIIPTLQEVFRESWKLEAKHCCSPTNYLHNAETARESSHKRKQVPVYSSSCCKRTSGLQLAYYFCPHTLRLFWDKFHRYHFMYLKSNCWIKSISTVNMAFN